ncbi:MULTISPECIES: hypothetical protein [unclassified Novosphingobium]|uniref:hypothetical protein n=1 Tax=unclassified Novosphingobium TaxID=2644732 RepID=UPI00146BE35D|nr:MULTISPECIES: hypothetical protein [unclassified Novosphingobium]NMN03677.1 hypothetical protein [Novosphingobium sp. SG919]NMN86333.1 hypothetical protein [Novosphingobium sp. SG916]
MIAAPPVRTSLAAIITAARAGSLGFAMAMFEAGGWSARGDDPAALATQARLLKEAALRARGAARTGALVAAADAFAAAAALNPQPWLWIDEAVLRRLAGDCDAAERLARRVLAALTAENEWAETPYFIAAARAQAHLVCGEATAARAAFAAACAADPDGWADRAATLRQMALVLAAMGADAGWLDAFRPPRSLNFAGHLGVSAAAGDRLRDVVGEWLTVEGVGFGFGALAAGADIVVAEALLARGSELHVVLPIGVEAFIAQSVMPYDPAWLPRFHACLDAAQSVRCLTALRGAYEPLATRLAADVAMGAAVLNARMLASGAAQLLITDGGAGRFGAGLSTAYLGERWRDAGPQHCIAAVRDAPVVASGALGAPEGRVDRRLAAMLWIGFAGLDDLDEDGFSSALDAVIAPFRAACAALPVQPELTLPVGNARLVAFADPDAAWAYACALLAMPPLGAPGVNVPLRVSGHYALAHWLEAPAALVGRGIAELGMIAAAALPGVLTASETLAAALCVNQGDRISPELVGEVDDIRLFAISAVGD